jgi:hypothetical protein
MKIERCAASALLAALLAVGCGPGGAAECVDADSGCSQPIDEATQAACAGEFGPGYEARVCEDGTGAECEELEAFGTPRRCVAVTVTCCPEVAP